MQTVEQSATVWMVNDVPVRMVFAGKRWRVTDMPTRLRDSIWSVPLEAPHPLYGWRFQGTDDAGESYVFDVYKGEHGWHVHHTYA
ncbi:hypothetical protein [Microbacterium sp. 13-71-7]|uniref:hypothetical protein n=1 Tax=Microbacterium sp. 13-71-7 TaxID=1970399 RepID=UPI000BCCBA56|nr:hypothetical protein [Microbacterium sp. 13-71-7]OZB80607.1 MAG: hypothetical protein B7X32_19015 [Microbacterium sp. 13-71-7]